MQESWVIGLAVFGLLLLWLLWQAIENAIVGGFLGLIIAAVGNGWKTRRSRKQP